MKQKVTIPVFDEKEGLSAIEIELNWVCPVCGKPRGEIRKATLYAGSRRVTVDAWENPCGHVDTYAKVREEDYKRMKKEGD